MARKFPVLWKIGLLLLLFLFAVNRLPATYAAASPAPILVVTNSAYTTNPFGSYLGEILRAEGVNEFDQVDISSISSAQLGQYSVVILADTTLTSAQAATLSGYVNAGGKLIAMHPDPQLAAVLGLGSSAGPPQTDGYLKISPTAQINGETPGQGLYTDTMQIHGSVERFTPLAGATVVATLYSDAVTATAYPAITYNVYGSGQAIAFLYDLAKNVVYTRQGNPANVNLDVDGDGVIRTIDLFQKQGGGAGWVDLNKVPVPQADIQQRLFVRLIKEIRGVSGPLPQLWYFPNSAKTMLIMTGDAHANPTSYFQNEITSINKYNGKITFYLAIGSSPTPNDILTWLPMGHTFGIHPYAYKPDPYPPYNITSLQQGYSVYYNWFTTTYSVAPYNIPMSLTVRNHQVAWAGWTDSADYAATYGIAMDTSFYDWGAWLKKPDGTWPHGYITGSGQPMKFARSNGSLVPVYQQLTQLIDEQLLGAVSPNLENLTGTQAIPVSQQMIDASLGGNYAALMTQNHVDYYGFGDPQTWAEGTMAYANSKGVPIWNADSWLNFTQTRHDANISNVVWDPTGGVLSYALTASPNSNFNLTLAVPWNYNGKVLTGALVDSVNKTVSQQTINGLSVGFINVTAGSHTVSAFYGAPAATLTPTSTPIPPTATSTPTATATNLPPTATLTPTATSTGPIPTATATATASATPTATPTGTVTPFPSPTSTPLPAPGINLVLSSYTDFASSCALISGAHVSDIGGGAVSLAAIEADDFTGTILDTTKWSAGNWNGSAYSPTFSNSVMSIAASGGAWVRSVPTYTHATLEAIATFGNTAYQHIGYGSDGFTGNRYFLFSTYLGDGNLYARVNNNVTEQNLNLGPIPVGMHHYRIAWSASDASNDLVVFYIDGTQVASFTVTNVSATGFYAYISNTSATVPLQVDALQSAPAYTSSGSYQSCVYDAGSTNTWQSIAWDPSVPAGTGASVQVNTSNDNVVWTGWTGVSTASGSTLPAPARYVQFQLGLNTTNPALTSLINSVTLNAVATATATPTSTTLPATPTFTPTASNTPVPTATNTPTATATNTPLPTATNTPLPTATNTPLPTATDTLLPTATDTPFPTATNTPLPTATNTPLPTATDTPLPTATNTPFPTATNTLLPTATDTPLPTATNTPLPTATNTLLPTPTFTPTPTAVPTLADSIFASSFETGNLSEWTSATTNSGNLSASSTARLVGNYGMQAVISNNNPMSVHDASPASEATYRARFYFSPNSISMRNNDAHMIFTASSGSTTVIRWQFRFNSNGQYQLQGSTFLNNGSFSSTGWFTISNAPHYIELSWVSASTSSSTDGSMQWWIDGQLRATQSGLANGLYRIDDAYLGPQSGIDSTTRGTEFFDAFASHRFTYIGP